jgi:hypothetical protein
MTLHLRRRLAVLTLTTLMVAMTVTGAAQPWRSLAVFAFVLLAPGIALRPWLVVADRVTTSIVVVAISVALTCLVSQALAIAHLWSAPTVLVVVAVVSVLALFVPREGLR